VTYVLPFLFVLGVLVFIHELGHFLLARWNGVRVLTFSLGFGPKLLKVQRGDTEYCISAVPLGGYVKMAGENPDDPHTGADDEFLAKFRNAPTPQERLRYLYALAEFPTAAQIQRTIDLAWSGEVKTQDAPFLLNRCIANRANGTMAWNAVRQGWDEANERFPSNTIVRRVDPVRLLNRPEVVADVQGFFAEHPITQATKTLDQILERQRVNAALRERESERLGAELS